MEETNNFLENSEEIVEISNPRGYFLVPYLIVIIIALVVLFFVFNPFTREEETEVEAPEQKSTQVFENLDLEAKAVYVWDVINQREIYSKNAEAQLPLASLTKVMMAITALSQVPEGTIITISKNDLIPEGDNGLLINERWVLADLIDFSLIVSSNDGATAIANAINSQVSGQGNPDRFVSLMNSKTQEINLKQTYFTSPSGLDKEDIIPGGNGSARDMALLFEYAIIEFRDMMEATTYSLVNFNSLSNLEHQAENTNNLVIKLPGIIASKTGFTDLAGGNLVIAFEPEPGRHIILVVLGSSMEGRFEDIEKLYLTTLGYIN